jgi:Zn-dependent protease
MLIYAAAFLLHEIAHKFAAQKFGYWAEFRINEMGIMFTLLSMFSPLKLVAPGAVVISGMLYGEEYGKISLAGPVSNILQAIILLITRTWAPNLFIYYLTFYGMKINASLAIFNLLPFGVFDGAKIMRWDIRIWVAAMAASVILYLF